MTMFHVKQSKERFLKTTMFHVKQSEERLLIITNVSRETLRETEDLVQNNLYILFVVSSESTAQKSIT